jgi:hypothetical protein
MFAYFTKINNKGIIDYTQDMLYFNEDDDDDDNDLYKTAKIAKIVMIQPQDEVVVREDIPPLFSYN